MKRFVTFNVRDDLQNFLEKRTEALIRKDTRFFNEFLSDNFLYINSKGDCFNKAEYILTYVESSSVHFLEQRCEIMNVVEHEQIIEMEFILIDRFEWNGEENKTHYICRQLYSKDNNGRIQWVFGQTNDNNKPLLSIPFLTGDNVILSPMNCEEINSLWDIASDEQLWAWTLHRINSKNEMYQYCAQALCDNYKGYAIPFIIKEKSTKRVVGSTRFGSVDIENKHMEIGWTWIGKEWQRTAINTEMKYLMMQYGFEYLGLNRISIITDTRNIPSQKAIERLGFVKEGIIRQHLITHNGYVRDSVSYSMIKEEWEQNKVYIEKLLAKYK